MSRASGSGIRAAGHSLAACLVAALQVVIALTIPVQSAKADEQGELRVLFVSSFGPSIPWTDQYLEGLQPALSQSGQPYELFTEFMELTRFPGPEQAKAAGAFLDDRYQGLDLDYVVVDGNPAISVFTADKDLLSGVDRVFVNEGPVSNPGDAVLIRTWAHFAAAAEQAIEVSGARRLVVVADTLSPGGANRLKNFQGATDEVLADIEVEYWVDLPFPELLGRVSELESDTAVYYLLIFTDGTGQSVGTPFQAMREIASASAVPAFSNWAPLMGSGITGGYMLSSRKVGEFVAEVLLDLNNGAEAPQVEVGRTHQGEYDWRELVRYRIPTSAIPADAEILYYDPDLWQQYGTAILIAIAIVLLLAGLAFTLWAREHRTRGRLAHASGDLERTRAAAKWLARTNRDLTQVAQTDPLTGLPNRRALEEYLETATRHAREINANLTVLLIDLDRFKDFNDEFGHIAGDDALRSVADILQKSIREGVDMAARFGGEEFLVVLAHSDATAGNHCAARIRNGLRGLRVPAAANAPAPYLTASIGMLTLSGGDVPSSRELIQRVDGLMFEAKTQGRDRIVSE